MAGWAGGLALLTGGAVAVTGATAAAAATVATGGSGASLPYVEVQAENSPTNGTVIGPSYAQGQLADEASGRKAVTLQGSGSYVTFTTPIATNSIDLRYSIPDTSSGSVYTAPLSLYVNGTKQTDLSLTNAYSWYYGSYPFTNTPGSGNPHHFYDEVHRLFSTTYAAGTTFKLQVDSGDTAGSYTIDLADFENVGAPLAQPSGSVSITSEGADPTGAADSTNAFNAAIAAAGSGGTVWIPAGTYNVPGHISVNNVTIAGAGMWYSTVTGTAPGFYGNSAPNPSTNVHLSNFAIFGNVQERNDSAQVNGIGGALSNSTVSNIWIDHMKVGAWMDGPMTNLTFSGMRIRDTTADGINFHGGVTSSTVTNSDIRNTGDDGIATWADSGIGADAQDTISNNTVQLQQLANGIAIYGGNNNTVSGNLVVDTGITQGGGITVAQRFSSTPVGLTNVTNNTLIRDGDLDPNWQFGVGALWFDGSQGSVTGPINVTNALIEQSPYEAVQWVEGSVSGVSLNDVTIAGTGTFALQEQDPGTATFQNVTATGVGQATLGKAPSYNCEGNGFVVTDNGGNSGITPTQCNGWPAPVFPPYPASGVQVSPGALGFGSQATGTKSAAQTVTVSNPVNSAAAVSSISVSGPFAETNTCGSSIAANGSCAVSVTFSPTASGSASGTLTVNAGGVTNTVALSGTGIAPGPVLNANPASLSFPGTIVGNSSSSQSVTVTNSGTSAATVSGVSVSGPFSQTNTCSSLAVGASCTVSVTYKPTAAGASTGSLTVTSNANNSPTTVGLSGSGIGATTNIGTSATLSASSAASGYPALNANDGNTGTYWESSDGAAYPQTLTAQFSQQMPLGSVTLTLPPSSAWATRTETLSVLGSNNGSSWTTLVPSAGYTFNPASGNTVSFSLPANSTYQYLQLSFTGNTGWSAAQLSEFQIYPATGGTGPTGGATLSASPSSVSFGNQNAGTTSAAKSVTISNSGSAAASISSISTAAPFAETNTCGSSLAAGASCTASVTFTPTAGGTSTGSLTVASNASNSSLTVALSGTGVSSNTNLALNRPATASSYTQTYTPANVVDGNTSSYWESVNGSWPATVTVDLGSSTTLGSLVLDLPPSSAWQTRTQTLSVLGSTDDSTWKTLVGSATYTWNPSTGNTVTVNLPSGTADRYVELSFTANSVQNGAQLSELEIFG
ncbi:MAG TPA: choice-of-anchor D domain-containing protein [Actinospica sp.]|nr:choice-of-anchor D domain-containing protein [Actinospica sp.]